MEPLKSLQLLHWSSNVETVDSTDDSVVSSPSKMNAPPLRHFGTPRPTQLEFQDAYWGSTVVSFQGEEPPTPEEVWIRRPRLERTASSGSSLRPRRSHPERAAAAEREDAEVVHSNVRLRSRSPKRTIYPRISRLRFHNEAHELSPLRLPPSSSSSARTSAVQAPTLPAQVPFQDVFWERIAVATAGLDDEFLLCPWEQPVLTHNNA